MTRYQLPDLPFEYSALEPYISAEVMYLHHDKHHRAYVMAANAAIEAIQDARRREDFSQIASLERSLAFNVSGHVLHSIFWQNLNPDGGGTPTGELLDVIRRDFGSFAHLQKQLVQCAMSTMGSGWAALVYDPVVRRLGTTLIHDHQSEVTAGGIPLMVIDAWEHAYYLQYRSEKARFFSALFNLWSFKDVEQRLKLARRVDLGLPRAALDILADEESAAGML